MSISQFSHTNLQLLGYNSSMNGKVPGTAWDVRFRSRNKSGRYSLQHAPMSDTKHDDAKRQKGLALGLTVRIFTGSMAGFRWWCGDYGRFVGNKTCCISPLTSSPDYDVVCKRPGRRSIDRGE